MKKEQANTKTTRCRRGKRRGIQRTCEEEDIKTLRRDRVVELAIGVGSEKRMEEEENHDTIYRKVLRRRNKS